MQVRHRPKKTLKPRQKKPRRLGKSSNIEKMVKAGVEQFILKEATIDDFFRTLRLAAGKNYVYSHQLTQALFSTIVRQALKKRTSKLQKSRRGKRTSTLKGKP